MEGIGERIIKLRKARGLSQESLAREIGVGRSTIVHIESDQHIPKTDILYKLATFFDTSSDYILGLRHSNGYPNYVVDIAKMATNLSEEMQIELRGAVRMFVSNPPSYYTSKSK